MRSLILAAIVAAAAPAGATVLVDNSAMTGVVIYGASNRAFDQNFLSNFTLTTPAHITGFDVFADFNSGYAGQGVTIKVRADAGGSPASTNFITVQSTIDSVSPAYPMKELTTRFGGFDLGRGTWWFGVSGTGDELSTILYDSARPGQDLYGLQVDDISAHPGASGYHIPFRVIGTAAGAIPEPASWALLIAGFGLTGAALRRRAILTAEGAI